MPLLTNPWFLLGLVSLPALVAIYTFRNRFRRRPVSSHILWATMARAKEGGAIFKRIQVPLIFLLELLVLLLLVAAAVDPRWAMAGKRQTLVVVLDDSASMLAEGDSGTPRDRAMKAILREIRRHQFHGIRLIVAGVRPQTLGPTVATTAEVRALLQTWRCRAPDAALDAAAALALELGGKRGAVLVVTDHPPASEPQSGKIRWLAFGEPLPNIAFVNAARTAGMLTDKCFVEVANLGPDSVRVPMVMTVDGVATGQQAVIKLDPGETGKHTFEIPSAVAALSIAVPDDVLPVDNKVDLLRAPVHRIRVAARIGDEALRDAVDQAIRATGMRSSASSYPQLLFTDAAVTQTAHQACWTVRLYRGSGAKAYVGPFVLDHAHPITDGLGFSGVAWGADPAIEPPGMPVIMAGNVALVSDLQKKRGTHDIGIQLVPDLSTLQETPNWPSLIWNLMTWRASVLPGLHTANLRVGMNARLQTREHGATIAVTRPDGETFQLTASATEAQIETDMPGFYEVTEGEASHRFAANFLAAEESDLSQSNKGQWGDWRDSDQLNRSYLSASWIFVLIGMAALAAHMVAAGRAGGKI